MITPLIELAFEGKSFIDPEIESRIVEVKNQDENSPMAILEPNEKIMAKMLAAGQSNEQIAARLGFKDKRTISRINGQIYAAWDLNESSSDEKVARNKAVPYFKTVSLLLFGVFVLVFFLFIGGGIGIIQDPVFQSDNDHFTVF
ncbi:transcriptional regulator, LuxR domain protein [Leptospira weilii serovar Topaz str. LT2116]|uniref:Transcriptional regulator, LuxR domain protein n=1 Tax=Leptospira weilii serovar Topaz str. LT2116 TaxID=1088540 RepID=M3H1B2_9LEPT|nr:transcriptional regulator, LuxR domain protein [Leptospira weilii serovar Topaz str. LT2116]